MGGLADQMLAGGCASQVELIHGEQITVLTGADAGKFFTAVLESEQSDVIDAELGQDVRAKWFARFRRDKPLPNVDSQDQIKDSGGKVWKLVSLQPGSFLTLDYEIIEVTAVDT